MPAWSAHLYPFAKHPGSRPALADLHALADAGYASVEAFPSQIESTWDDLRASGLGVSGLHVTTAEIAGHLAELIHQAQTWSAPTIVVSGPLGWSDRSVENWRGSLAILLESAEACAGEGITVCYHNHDFEFRADADGWRAADLLMSGIAGTALRWCLDLGWVDRAGADPVAVVAETGAALHTVHFRDFDRAGSCALGAGDVALAACLAACSGAPGLVHRVVEADPQEAAAALLVRSREFLGRCGAWAG